MGYVGGVMTDIYDPDACVDAQGNPYPQHDYGLFGCWRCGAKWAQPEEVQP